MLPVILLGLPAAVQFAAARSTRLPQSGVNRPARVHQPRHLVQVHADAVQFPPVFRRQPPLLSARTRRRRPRRRK